MALINNDQLDALAEDIVPTIPDATEAQTEARVDAVANVRNLTTKICAYIVAHLELKPTVAIELDAIVGDGRTIETYALGLGSNHTPPTASDMAAPPYPVTGSVKSSKDYKGKISNAGEGLVL